MSVRSLPGERDRNFHLHTADRRDFVLKILDFNSSPEATDCQLRVLEHLAEQDPALPVPRVYPTALGGEIGTVAGREGSYATCLMGYLPGELLAGRSPDAPLLENLGRHARTARRGAAGLLSPGARSAPGLGRPAPAGARRACRLYRIARLAAQRAKRRSRAQGAPSRLALAAQPGDSWRLPCSQRLGRSRARSGISGILDFGDMVHAPRVLEPAVAMSELLAEERVSMELLPFLLAGYARRTPLEAAELELLYDLILAPPFGHRSWCMPGARATMPRARGRSRGRSPPLHARWRVCRRSVARR